LMPLLLFFDVVLTFAPLQHHSYSSLTRLLLLMMQLLLLPFQVPLCSPLMLLLVLVLDVAITFPISNWYFPSLHVFASVGKNVSFWVQLASSKFFQGKLKGEFVFFPKCLFVGDICSLSWLSIFFYVNLVDMFVCCVQELFGHCAFHLHICSFHFFKTLHFLI
jgi:hypothetical protein